MKTQDGKYELPVVYLDIETNELAAEVGGWGNCHLLTMGVAVTYGEHEPQGTQWRIWRAGQEVALCQYLTNAKLVVGHNLFRFDYKVLWGALNRVEYIPIDLIPLRDEKPDRNNGKWGDIHTIDTLATLKEATGRFIGLDNLGESTLRRGKTDGMSGEKAPIMLREGRWKEVAVYCRDDVALIRDLFRYGVEKGVVWYVDMRSRKPRFAKPNWPAMFDSQARVRGTPVKKSRKR